VGSKKKSYRRQKITIQPTSDEGLSARRRFPPCSTRLLPSSFSDFRFAFCAFQARGFSTNRPFPLIRHGRTCSLADF
jgi:hypothetical protein